jgi:hypothetical protein
VVLAGSFSEGIDPSLLRLAGVTVNAATPREKIRLCEATTRAPDLVKNVPPNFTTYCRPADSSVSADTKAIYLQQGFPALSDPNMANNTATVSVTVQ